MEKLKIKFHPLFWIFVVILIITNNFISVFSYLLCVFLHELGHFLMANFLGYRLNVINFLPFGASISGRENVFYKSSHEVLISIAGPFINLILLIVCLALFWCFPVLYYFLDNFYLANLVTLFFNFIPVFPLDGGRVMLAMFKSKFSSKTSYKIVKIIGFVFAVLIFVLFIISAFYKINFSLGLTSIFLIAGLFFEDTSCYYVANYNFLNKEKKLWVGLETNILSISEKSNLYSVLRKLNKYKYNIINVLNEKGKIKKVLTEEEMKEIFVKSNLYETLQNIKND